jgi:hypothetical protein
MFFYKQKIKVLISIPVDTLVLCNNQIILLSDQIFKCELIENGLFQ